MFFTIKLNAIKIHTMKKSVCLIVNFGGPRRLEEVYPFLQALLTDRDVVRTRLPGPLHRLLFSRIAKKRAKKVDAEYRSMGGKSPIYEDTEAVAARLREKIKTEVLVFHRYIPATHSSFIKEAATLDAEEIRVFPMFPQFTYATTGSAARWFEENLPAPTVNKMRWIKSYPTHPAYVAAQQGTIRRFLEENELKEEEVALLFSAHGVPQLFMETGDIYQDECESSVEAVMRAFPKAVGKLAYQSKFGPGEWLRPYTEDACEQVKRWSGDRPAVVVVPISFTSDHIETLVEIEQQYLPLIREQGLRALRLPAFNRSEEWIDAIASILKDKILCTNQMLVRKTSYP